MLIEISGHKNPKGRVSYVYVRKFCRKRNEKMTGDPMGLAKVRDETTRRKGRYLRFRLGP